MTQAIEFPASLKGIEAELDALNDNQPKELLDVNRRLIRAALKCAFERGRLEGMTQLKSLLWDQ